MKTKGGPSNEQRGYLTVKSVMTDVQALNRSDADVSRVHCIEDNYKLKEHTIACIHDWAEVISKQCDSGIKRLAIQIVDHLRVKNIELLGIRETPKNVSACI